MCDLFEVIHWQSSVNEQIIDTSQQICLINAPLDVPKRVLYIRYFLVRNSLRVVLSQTKVKKKLEVQNISFYSFMRYMPVYCIILIESTL